MRVFIVVLNYNGFSETRTCIHSLEDLTSPEIEIVIVDNCSLDGSGSLLREEFRSHHFVQNDRNGGYAYGMNRGIEYSLNLGAEAVLLMNNDIIVEPDFLQPLTDSLIADSSVGIVSPKVIYQHDTERIYCAGGRIDFLTCSARSMYQGKERSLYGNDKRTIDFAEGCCLLVRSTVFREIGLIPEQYFMYFEDIHFSHEVRKKYLIQYEPKSIIYHKSGAGAGWTQHSSLYQYFYTRNRIIYFSHDRSVYFYYVLLFSIAVVCAKTITVAFSLQSDIIYRIIPLWKGLFDGIKVSRA